MPGHPDRVRVHGGSAEPAGAAGARSQAWQRNFSWRRRSGDAAAVRTLIATGAPIETRDADKRTPLLHRGAARSHRGGARAYRGGCRRQRQGRDRRYAVPLCRRRGPQRDPEAHPRHAASANLRDTNRYGGTALIPAAHHGHPETVRMLLGTDIDIDHVNRLGWTALLEAVILGDGGTGLPGDRRIAGRRRREQHRRSRRQDAARPRAGAGFGEIAARIAAGPRK